MTAGLRAYESSLEVCGNMDHPGAALAVRQWLDFVGRETTADQARIESCMEAMGVSGKTILHVGVGNSRLAERFSPLAQWIDGITVSENERRFGESLNISKYSVLLLNKYSHSFSQALSRRYDLIVDNNLASFSCCKYHFYLMLNNYLACLAPRGQILTEQQGMSWAAGEPSWRLTYADLEFVGPKFSLRASRLSESVYSLQKQE
jgi:hypothetical protein